LKGEKLKVKNKIMVLIFLVAILIGCIDSTPSPIVITATPTPTIKYVTETPVVYITATPQPSPSATDEPGSDTPTPTYTEAPSATLNASTSTATVNPDPGGTLTPTRIFYPTADPNLPNLLPNSGMDEFYDYEQCNEDGCEMHKIPVGYETHYCDVHYMPEPCDALMQGNGNPIDLKMRRPEYTIAHAVNYPNRVHSGETAAQWFCYAGACRAGLYRVVETEPGWSCEVGAYFQMWNNYKGGIESEDSTPDDRANITVRIMVNLSGKTLSFLPENASSRWYGYDDFGGYDKWGKVTYRFVTNDFETTVFFESLVLYPVTNNDVYLDDIYMRCVENQ
jgi:hypothetical protein